MKKHLSGKALQLAPLEKQAVVFLGVFTVILPAIVIIAILVLSSRSSSVAISLVAAAVVAAVSGVLVACTRRRSVTQDSDRIVLRATLYKRQIALGEIDLENARVLDLREHPEHRPRLKTNGLAVPGLAAGNFLDRNRNKLFCLVTAPRVVLLPMKDGSRVLLSPAHPELFLAEVRESGTRENS